MSKAEKFRLTLQYEGKNYAFAVPDPDISIYDLKLLIGKKLKMVERASDLLLATKDGASLELDPDEASRNLLDDKDTVVVSDSGKPPATIARKESKSKLHKHKKLNPDPEPKPEVKLKSKSGSSSESESDRSTSSKNPIVTPGRPTDAGLLIPLVEHEGRAPRFVGRIEGCILLYDIVSKRRYTIKPNNVQLHECCEGIEIDFSLFLIGGKDDDGDTYEMSLRNIGRELIARAEMIQGRCNHALCQIKDKVIYCAGGIYHKSTTGRCEKFDIEKNDWTEVYTMNECKHNGTMCSLANRYIFYIGGGKVGHSSLFSTIEMLDTESDEGWKILKFDTPWTKWEPVECVSAVGINDNEMLIFGGWEKEQESRSKVFVFNLNKLSITALPGELKKNSAFFYRLTPIINDGKVYAMSPDECIHIYSFDNMHWDIIESSDWKDQLTLDLTKPLIVTGRVYHALWIYEMGQGYGHEFAPKNLKVVDCSEAVLVDSTIYLVGGQEDSNLTLSLDIMHYKKRLERKANMIRGRYNHALEQVAGKYLYCVGGCASTKPLRHCEKYSIRDDKWFALPKLKEKKQNMSICVCSDRMLYSFGGALLGNEALFSTVERLDILDESFGWQILNLPLNNKWRPVECMGSVQISEHNILLFGGWKPKREESGKCFIFDTVTRRIRRLRSKLKNKSGFYYAIRPRKIGNKVYMMDPDFNVDVFDIPTLTWSILRKDEWKAEDSEKKEQKCSIF